MPAIGSRTALLTLTLTLTLATSGCNVPSDASASSGPAALARATPESVGMSSERLTRLHDAMQELVDDGRLSGITTMIARRGQVVDFEHGETIAFIEAERRFGERWVGSVEMRVILNTDTTAPLHTLRRDDFLTFSLSRFF